MADDAHEADTLAGSLHATGSRSHAPLGVPDAWLRRRGVEGRQRVSGSHAARYLISPPPDARVAPSRLAALSPQEASESRHGGLPVAVVMSAWRRSGARTRSLGENATSSRRSPTEPRSVLTMLGSQLPAVGMPSTATSGSSTSPSCHLNHSRAHSGPMIGSSVILPSATAWHHSRTWAWVRWVSRRRLARRRQLVEQDTDGRPRPGCWGNTVRTQDTRACRHAATTSTGKAPETVRAGLASRFPARCSARFPVGFADGDRGVAASGLGIFGPHRTGDYPSAHAQSRITLAGQTTLGDTPHTPGPRSSDRRWPRPASMSRLICGNAPSRSGNDGRRPANGNENFR